MKSVAINLTLLVLIAVFPAYAEAQPVSISDDQILRGEFTQERFLSGFDSPLKSSGEFVLSPKQGLIWRTMVPFQVTTVISPAGLLQYAGGKEVLRLSASRMPALSDFYEMVSRALSGHQLDLGKGFEAKQTAKDGKWRIELKSQKPQAQAKSFEAVTVSGAKFAEGIVIHKPRGDRDEIVFSRHILSADPLSTDEVDLLSGKTK